jgi:hypothetical protein
MSGSFLVIFSFTLLPTAIKNSLKPLPSSQLQTEKGKKER